MNANVNLTWTPVHLTGAGGRRVLRQYRTHHGYPEVEKMITGIGRVLRPGGLFCLYGHFNYGGEYTSESNARFDVWLKDRDPKSGIRNFEDLDEMAVKAGMELFRDYEVPQNNRISVWRRGSY